jgi:hypothetical protein
MLSLRIIATSSLFLAKDFGRLTDALSRHFEDMGMGLKPNLIICISDLCRLSTLPVPISPEENYSISQSLKNKLEFLLQRTRS